MTLKKSLVATLISTVMCLPAVAQESDFSKRLYVGIGAGSSKLSPESQVPAFSVEDESDSASKIFIGYDFKPRIAIELSAADLGAAGIGPGNVGSIDYQVAELSALYHFFNLGGYEALLERRGLGAFLKVGFGAMDNESELAFTRENDIHLSGGLGVEYATRLGLALRGEIEAFDKDAMLSSLSLLWRFGGKGGSSSNDGLFSAGGGLVGGLIGDGDDTMTATDEDDKDNDGVPDSIDDCMNTAPGEAVTATGCAIFGGVLEGVQFESGSDKLLDEAQVVLNDAADALLSDPNLQVEVQAHTDSQGAAEFNIALSKDRALATVRYLMLRGVPAEQMTARAFGESKPIADNSTAEGRKANRRVEFHVIER